MRIVVLILAGIFLSIASADAQCDSVPVLADTSAFRAMVERHDGMLFDVRTPEEYRSGYIKGAINIDFRSPEFNARIAALDTSKTYYLYCEVGGRSRMAGEYMLSHGFCHIIVLQGGMKQWKAANYPIIIPPKSKSGNK